jgi:hypothetical protein
MASQIPIEVVIKALNLTQPEIEKVKQGLETFKASQRDALGQHRQDVEKARHAAQMLGQTFGVQLPEGLRKVMAESRTVGAALTTAFNASVILAFAQAIFEVGKEVYELVESLHKLSDEEKKTLTDVANEAKRAMDLGRQVLEIERQKTLLGKTDAEQARLKARWAAEDARSDTEQLNRLQKQYDLAVKMKELFDSGAKREVLTPGSMFAKREDVVSGAEMRKAEAVILEIGPLLEDLRTKATIAQTSVGLAAAQAGEAAKKAYGTDVADAMQRAAEAAKFLLGKLDEHVQKLAELKHSAKNITLDQAEDQLRFFELAFQLNPEDKGLLLEGLLYWQEQVELATKRMDAEIDAAGVQAGKSYAEGLTKGIADFHKTYLPKLGPSLFGDADRDQVTGKVKPDILPDPNAFSMSNAKFDEMSTRMRQIQGISQEIGDSFSHVFAQMVQGTHSVSAAFADMAQSMVASIASVITKMLIMAIVERAIGFVVGALGGGASFMSGGTATVLSQDAFGMTLAGARAGGGPVSANMPYLIGERGPELFMPSSSGNIVPNGKFGGGVTVVNNIVNESGTSIRARESGPQFDGKKWVQTIIIEDVSSNGPIGQLLKGRR